jgi:hypothetical protein
VAGEVEEEQEVEVEEVAAAAAEAEAEAAVAAVAAAAVAAAAVAEAPVAGARRQGAHAPPPHRSHAAAEMARQVREKLPCRQPGEKRGRAPRAARRGRGASVWHRSQPHNPQQWRTAGVANETTQSQSIEGRPASFEISSCFSHQASSSRLGRVLLLYLGT